VCGRGIWTLVNSKARCSVLCKAERETRFIYVVAAVEKGELDSTRTSLPHSVEKLLVVHDHGNDFSSQDRPVECDTPHNLAKRFLKRSEFTR